MFIFFTTGFSQPSMKTYITVHMEHGGYFAKTYETKTKVDLGTLEGLDYLKEVEKLNSETEIINYMSTQGWQLEETMYVLFGQMFDKELFFSK